MPTYSAVWNVGVPGRPNPSQAVVGNRLTVSGTDCREVATVLVFIDESGHPHPKDSTMRPVLAAVCFPERESRSIGRQLFGIKRSLLGDERAGKELKANQVLNRRTFNRRSELRELLEEVFEQIQNLDITIFAVVMEKPEQVIPRNTVYLPRQYRYILQRVNALLTGEQSMAFVLVDGDGSQYGELSAKLERFLNRSYEGRAMTNVVDTPYFVDSRYTMGIQIADLVAGVIRQYQEAELFRDPSTSDLYLRAIARYYRIIKSKTKDFTTDEGYPLQGIYFMTERLHYFDDPEDEVAGGEQP